MSAFDYSPNTMLKETERNPECDIQTERMRSRYNEILCLKSKIVGKLFRHCPLSSVWNICTEEHYLHTQVLQRVGVGRDTY